MKERIQWIDVMKFFGIFQIYLGHYGKRGGALTYFALAYTVALFFFVSGCTENLSKETSFVKYVGKKVKTILLPCYFFAFLTVILEVIQNGYGVGFVKGSFLIIAKGMIRNTFENATLWFLTCLFSIHIIFFMVKKLKNRVLILLASFGLYYVALTFLPSNPMYSPSWIYNIDSALFYVFYFAIGYVVYPYIVKIFALDTMKKKVFFGISGVLSIVYASGIYFGVDIIAINFTLPPIVGGFYPIFSTFVVIWAHLVVARVFQDAKFFVEVGKNTLYLCGSEYIIKNVLECLTSLFGIWLWIEHPLQTYVYVIFLLIVTNKYLVPIEKNILKKIIK